MSPVEQVPMPILPIMMLYLQLCKRSTLQHEALWHLATQGPLTTKRLDTSITSQLPGPAAVQRSALGSSVQLSGTPLYAAPCGQIQRLEAGRMQPTPAVPACVQAAPTDLPARPAFLRAYTA